MDVTRNLYDKLNLISDPTMLIRDKLYSNCGSQSECQYDDNKVITKSVKKLV